MLNIETITKILKNLDKGELYIKCVLFYLIHLNSGLYGILNFQIACLLFIIVLLFYLI